MQPATDVILFGKNPGDKLEVADDEDLHSSDTVQEKLSLVYRFWRAYLFWCTEQKEFQNIVTTLAERYGVTMPAERASDEGKRLGAFSRRSHWKNGAAVY